MENLLLKKRFIFSKRAKFTGKRAYYYPTGVTTNENLEMGAHVQIKTEPIGGEIKAVDVSIVTHINRYSKEVTTSELNITVFLKDLSPV